MGGGRGELQLTKGRVGLGWITSSHLIARRAADLEDHKRVSEKQAIEQTRLRKETNRNTRRRLDQNENGIVSQNPNLDRCWVSNTRGGF